MRATAPAAVQITAQNLDRAPAVKGRIEQRAQRIALQHGLNPARNTADGVGGDMSGADHELHEFWSIPCGGTDGRFCRKG